MTNYSVTLTTTTPMLGTAPADPRVYVSFLIERALRAGKKLENMTTEEQEKLKQAVEAKRLDEVTHLVGYVPEEDKGMTTLRRDPNAAPSMIPDYMIRGFIKASAKAITDVWGVKGSIDQYIFVGYNDADGNFHADRWIPIMRDGEPIKQPELTLERSLRAQTMMGERTALSKSEAVGATGIMPQRTRKY